MTEEFIQLIYASKATFEPNAKGGVDREVARILMQSRRNNHKLNIGGVLYYGDGNFFQCLEGEPSVIEKAFGKIIRDSRHSQVIVLSRRKVANRTFADWSMKYVPAREEIQQMLKKNGFSEFDPYKFNDVMINQMIGILSDAEDPTGGAKRLLEAGIWNWLVSWPIPWNIVAVLAVTGLLAIAGLISIILY